MMRTKDKIDKDSIIKRNETLLFSKMDEEVVMLSIENSEYYGMNDVASRIWELIEQPKKVEHVIDILTDEYEIEKKVCEKDVLFYLEELQKKNVILKANRE